MPECKLSLQQLTDLLAAEFSEAFNAESGLLLEDVQYGECRVRQCFSLEHLRPGGTMSGPTMMRLADVSVYVALLGAIGWVPLAVTTQLNINFLRKPRRGDLIAQGRLIKLGKRLAVGEVSIRSDGEEDMCAHATSTYALPAA